MSLNDLPPEILHSIVTHLDHDHPSSLLDFARVNKLCYSATTPIILQTIKLSLSHRDDLARDVLLYVQLYSEQLERTQSFSFARRIVIDVGECRDGYPVISSADRGRGDHSTLDGYLENFKGTYPKVDISPEELEKINDAWKPLADFMKKLPGLTDLLFGLPDRFPPCLLHTLHQHHPQCRLHHHTFKMHSIMHPETDPSEFELITSPSLYSIRMQESAMGGFRPERIRDYHKYALMRLTSLAPNLKEVHHYANNRRMTRGWEPWSGFTQDKDKDNSSLGSLRCLRLSDTIPIEGGFLKDWAEHTDFSKLETLRIETEISSEAVDYLVRECDLSSLKTLVLNMVTDDVDLVQDHEYYDTARQLLSNLPRLSTLKLIGWHSELPFHTFLEHHGPGLRKLSLSVCPTDHLTCFQIARIVDFCPFLEDLELTIPRFRSDITEYTMYKLIGSLECLQRVSLTLDASNYDVLWNDGPAETPTDETFDEFDRQFCTVNSTLTRHPRNGHVRDAIINSAVDQHLASDIFNAISSGKPDGCLSLEKVILRVQGGGKFWNDTWAPALDKMVRNFPREWIVKRNQRDDSPDSLVMTEIRQTDEDEDEDPLDLPPWLEAIFRRIWPQKRERSKWWEDWESISLEWPDDEDTANGDGVKALRDRLYSVRV